MKGDTAMLNWFANITYTWNGKTYEVTIPFKGGENATDNFKVLHPNAEIVNIDYEM